MQFRAIRAIRIHFTGFRLWYNISAPLPVPHLLRVVAGEALRRFRAAQEHPGPAGDQGQARAGIRERVPVSHPAQGRRQAKAR